MQAQATFIEQSSPDKLLARRQIGQGIEACSAMRRESTAEITADERVVNKKEGVRERIKRNKRDINTNYIDDGWLS